MTNVMSDNRDDIINHLEFIGYEVEELNADTGYLYVARNDSKSNLMVRLVNNMCLLTARYAGFNIAALKSKDFYHEINEINQGVMSKWYYESNEENETVTVVIEADYYDYKKTTFGKFVDDLEKEVANNLVRFEKFYTAK